MSDGEYSQYDASRARPAFVASLAVFAAAAREGAELVPALISRARRPQVWVATDALNLGSSPVVARNNTEADQQSTNCTYSTLVQFKFLSLPHPDLERIFPGLILLLCPVSVHRYNRSLDCVQGTKASLTSSDP